MAKSGIDYFPLDVQPDSKLELIEAEYGITGFGVVVRLLMEIYGREGYYIEWTNEVALLFARKVGLGGGVVSEIVEASIRRGMFDKELYDKYHVLTSHGVQKRYFEAVSRRKELEVDENILLVNVAQICPHVNIKRKNVNILSENADIFKQSKVEESKVKQSKVEESIICAEPKIVSAPPVIVLPLNDGSEYPVSAEQVAEWTGLYPAVDVIQQLRAMRGWLIANPLNRKTKTGVLRFVNSWLAKDQNRGGSTARTSQAKQPGEYKGADFWD